MHCIDVQVGIALQKYVRDTPHASEHLFNPLQMSPQLGVPGAYTGKTLMCARMLRTIDKHLPWKWGMILSQFNELYYHPFSQVEKNFYFQVSGSSYGVIKK